MAKTNAHFSSLVSEILRRMFIKKQLIIANPYTDWLLDRSKFIGIQQFETAVNVLESFGHFIQNLTIENNSVGDERNTKIYELVRSNWKGLKRIHLTNPEKYFFSDIEKPFRNVEVVEITGDFDNVYNLVKMFPMMHRLELDVNKISNFSAIDNEYKFLDDLSVKLPQDTLDGLISEEVIGRLIEKNPQIRHLKLKHLSPNLLKIVIILMRRGFSGKS